MEGGREKVWREGVIERVGQVVVSYFSRLLAEPRVTAEVSRSSTGAIPIWTLKLTGSRRI